MPKRVAVSLVVVSLILSVSLAARWARESGPGPLGLRVTTSTHAYGARGVAGSGGDATTQQLHDCSAWAAMGVKEKKRAYKADPERWKECLCEGDGCLVDSYVTGKLSR